jgi:hypothetical protein
VSIAVLNREEVMESEIIDCDDSIVRMETTLCGHLKNKTSMHRARRRHGQVVKLGALMRNTIALDAYV